MQKKRLIRAKQRFFEQNGGVLLQQQMKSFKITTFKIYTKEELEKATNKFSEERVLGHGGDGIVYKGILEDGSVAAIKKIKNNGRTRDSRVYKRDDDFVTNKP
jgi:hypothetical protein